MQCCGWNDYNDLPSVPQSCCKGFSEDILNAANPSSINAHTCAKMTPTFFNRVSATLHNGSCSGIDVFLMFVCILLIKFHFSQV